MADVGVPVNTREEVIVPTAVPPPVAMTVTVPPRVEVPVGAGVSFATLRVAFQVVTGAVVLSLQATPTSTASTACTIDVRIASPLIPCEWFSPDQDGNRPARFRSGDTTAYYGSCRESRPGCTHPPRGRPRAYPNG